MAQAVPAQIESVQADSATTSALAPGVAPLGNTFQAPPDLVAPKRLPAHYLWAVLIARIYEVLRGVPAAVPDVRWADAQNRVYYRRRADQEDSGPHRCGLTSPSHIPATRATAVVDECDAQMGQGVQVEPDWDLAAQPEPDYEIDQRVNR